MKNLQYYKRLIKIFLSYNAGKTALSYMPIRVWIEPTNHCNLRCVMCPNKELKKEEKGFMDIGLFQKIIDEAARFVLDVHLLHRGESLLHPDFFDMARYAVGSKVRTLLHTNGTVLDEEKSYKMIETGIDVLSFSFDGYDKQTYESIRVNGDFGKTVHNIRRFLQIKKELNSKKPYTILELINFPDSHFKTDLTQRAEFLKNFSGLPLNKLVIKEFHNWAGEVNKEAERRKFSPCTYLWNALVIFWDGSVLPCSQDFFGYYTLGNVRDSSLAEIWNNEKSVHLRKQHLKKNIDAFQTCSACDRVWRDKFLDHPREYLWKFLFRKMH